MWLPGVLLYGLFRLVVWGLGGVTLHVDARELRMSVPPFGLLSRRIPLAGVEGVRLEVLPVETGDKVQRACLEVRCRDGSSLRSPYLGLVPSQGSGTELPTEGELRELVEAVEAWAGAAHQHAGTTDQVPEALRGLLERTRE